MQGAHKLLFGLSVWSLATSAWATSTTEHAMPPQHATVDPTVNPVRSIPFANRISNWEPLDTQHVLLSVDTQKHYLLTLRDDCPGLNYARNVGVTMSDNIIWAGFDAITTDAMQCAIQRIDLLVDSLD